MGHNAHTWAPGEVIAAQTLNDLELGVAAAAVFSDIGVAGTPTDTALRAAYGVGARTKAYGDPTKQPSGTPTSLTSGQPATSFGSAPIAVVSGLYKHTSPAATNTAGYLQADLGGQVGRIGGDVKIPVGATGAIALVLPLAAWSDGSLSEAGVHFVMYRDKWHVSHWNGAGEDLYAQGTFDTLLDDGGVHRVEINLSGATAYITFPDGSTVKVTDSRIASATSTLAIWELYEGNGGTDAPLAFAGIWADTVPPLGSSAAAPLDVAVGRSLIPRAAVYNIKAPASAAVVPVTTSESEVMRATLTIPTNFKQWVRLSGYLEVAAAVQVYFVVRATTHGGGGGQFEWQQLVLDSASAKGTYDVERLVDLTTSGFTPGDKVDLVWTVWGTANSAANIISDATRAATMLLSSVAA